MKISVRWLNHYLDHPSGGVSAEEAEHALTFAGFPIESAVQLPSGDTCLDVEVTSNRGDVLSHVGVAREIAAATGRTLRVPAPDHALDGSAPVPGPVPPAPSAPASAHPPCRVDNRVPDLCPLFTAQVIRGVKVGPSPAWLVEALGAVGQRSINNVVDVTNFVALELGQPSHVFDLGTIARAPGAGEATPGLIVRIARKGEKLRLLDGKTITLAGDEVVVADGESDGGRAISLAGVMGGADTEVSERTTDIILEAATWDPVAVRRAARRFNIRTDASYRFERTVDARTIEPAARRAAALIARLAGGRIEPAMVKAGPGATPAPVPAGPPIRLRPARLARMLGVEVPPARVLQILGALGIQAHPELPVPGGAGSGGGPGGGVLLCTPPAFRPDLTREIDLIEEVARVHGLDKLPAAEKIAARVAAPQGSERAMGEVARVLTGLGFYEAVTFTFVSEKAAEPFLPAGLGTLAVRDERRRADPVLRPSALPSLLACRRANQDAGVAGDGGPSGAGVRLYETSAVFAQVPAADGRSRGREVESHNLALIADACFPETAKPFERKQAAVRAVRGAVESLVRALGGPVAAGELAFTPAGSGGSAQPAVRAFDPAASGEVTLRGRPLGRFGLIADAVARAYDLAAPVAAAEVVLDPLIALYPARPLVRALPQFPSIERDLSLIVAEATPWSAIERLVRDARGAGLTPLMEDFWFVTTYRGQPVPPGKKSVTFRLRFRDPQDGRTLRHEEIDPQVAGLIDRARSGLDAVLRA